LFSLGKQLTHASPARSASSHPNRTDLVAINHQNRPRRTTDRQVCVRNVNEFASKSLSWFSLASTGSPLTKSIGTSSIPALLEFYRSVFKSFASVQGAPRLAPTTNFFPCAFCFARFHCSSSVQELPVRIPEVYLAEPAITRSQYFVATYHARLIPERNALAEYPPGLLFSWPGVSRALMLIRRSTY